MLSSKKKLLFLDSTDQKKHIFFKLWKTTALVATKILADELVQYSACLDMFIFNKARGSFF